jgi:hypothetical protein
MKTRYNKNILNKTVTVIYLFTSTKRKIASYLKNSLHNQISICQCQQGLGLGQAEQRGKIVLIMTCQILNFAIFLSEIYGFPLPV